MKATELIIGDWVYIAPTNHFAQVVGITTDCIETTYDKGYHNEVFFDPIPLIPEILEKNFQKDPDYINTYWRPNCRKFCFVKEGDDWYFAFRYKGGHICIAKCNYVHELQHALKLYKIEKEIVL